MKQTILVIEDDPSIRLGLEDTLRAKGYTVVVAGKGELGLSLAAEHRPDHRGNVGTATAANRAAGHAADHRTRRGADDGAGALNLHRAHAFDDAQTHVLFAPRLFTGI